MPYILEYCHEVGLDTKFNFCIADPHRLAELMIIDVDNPQGEPLMFELERIDGIYDIQKTQPLQQLAKVSTQASRILYIMAFEISETDQLQVEQPQAPTKPPTEKPAPKITESELKALKEVVEDLDCAKEIEFFIAEVLKKKIDNLTHLEYNSLVGKIINPESLEKCRKWYNERQKLEATEPLPNTGGK